MAHVACPFLVKGRDPHARAINGHGLLVVLAGCREIAACRSDEDGSRSMGIGRGLTRQMGCSICLQWDRDARATGRKLTLQTDPAKTAAE